MKIFNYSLSKFVIILISSLLIILYLLTFIPLYYFPIYPDEISWRFAVSRFPIDFPIQSNGLPLCTVAIKERLFPIIWYIPALIEWFIHGKIVVDLRVLRGIGLFFNLALVMLLTWEMMSAVRYKKTDVFIITTAGIMSLLGLGVLPIFLVTNRAEQNIVIGLLILLFLFKRHNFFKNQVWPILLFFLGTSILLYAHPKAMYLAPVVLFIGYHLFFSYKNILIRIALSIALLYQLTANYLAWNMILRCQDIILAEHLNSFNINIAQIFYQPSIFFDKILESISKFSIFFQKTLFQEIAEVSYLPTLKLSDFDKIINFFIYCNLIILLGFLLISLFLLYYRDIRKRAYISINLVLILIMNSVVIGSIFNSKKTWYDAGYFWIMIIICLVFMISSNLKYFVKRTFYKLFFVYFICVSFFSLCAFNNRYDKPFFSGWSGPGVSLVNYNLEQIQNDLSELSNLCHLDPNNDTGLILDDYTYVFFQKSKQAILITGLFYRDFLTGFQRTFNNDPLLDAIARVSYRQIDGLIVRCNTLYMTSMPFFHKNSLCCASKKMLEP